MKTSKFWRLFTFCVSGILLIVGMASAVAQIAQYRFSALKIELLPQVPFGVLAIANTGSVPLDFKVRVQHWQQRETGEDELHLLPPNSLELVAFPNLLHLPVGGRAEIRIRHRFPAPEVERTYRLLVAEILPAPQGPSSETRLVTVHSLPVFIKPAVIRRQGQLLNAQVQQGTLQMTLRNQGNVHIEADQIKVRGLAQNGQRLFEVRPQREYVLAGVTRPLMPMPLPQDQCAAVRTLQIVLDVVANPPATQVEQPTGVCR
ncbi:hypothetical protein NBE99_06740 [Thermosynechococcus sp. HN-54]|uniref:hypothetical protein n=1 Tax=Thermosynechococcus sp. HN-54 TaxID=2933959 RepID=UPI00202CFD5F|nr:hypothetical protein [Thermosynechococcus sp. HN-54]URR34352.1 hypothetical protein NBE99_06740 [Thermosynechococcus sp. HN-54]